MKTYLITGTSRGIGLALTQLALEQGNRVLATARHPEHSSGLMSLKDQYSDHLHLISLDVQRPDEIQKAAKAWSHETLDVLINNAGIYGSDEEFEKIPSQELIDVFTTNAVGPFAVTQAFLPHLKRSASPQAIHITSIMGSLSETDAGGYYAYRMSKAALNMFSKCLSIDHPEIISLVIHPGWVRTEMGGPSAPTPPLESASGILKVIARLSTSDSGDFLDDLGKRIAW